MRIAVVANKLDLNDDRVVPKKDGVKFSLVNNLRFFEASAKSGRNVKELFRSVCDSICDYWLVFCFLFFFPKKSLKLCCFFLQV